MKNDIDVLYRFQNRIGYLEKIDLRRDSFSEGGSAFSLEIVLSEYPFTEDSSKLNLICKGVKRFEMRNIDNLYMMSFNVEDLRQHQMEDICYSFRETENDCLSFICKDFTVQVIEKH